VRDSKNYKLIWTENPGQPDFEPHHQPFNYYTRFDPTTAQGQIERANHLQDVTNMLSDAANGTLPPVAFYKPAGNVNGHPGYSDVQDADVDLANVLGTLQKSPQWAHMAIVITTDEFGGFYDHVAPPTGDRWGPGSRIPAVVISPYAKKGYVDHTYYDTASILKFITKRFNLKALAGFRSATGDLTNAFDFTQAP
jgi:acid phosphatase